MLVGTFLAFDKHMNLVLSDTEEFIKIKAKKPGDVDREQKRALGLVLLRGENIVSLSAESPPSQASKRFSDIPNAGQGKSQPIGRGSTATQAPSGLSGPGRGVGGPGMLNMLPTTGRGAMINQTSFLQPQKPQSVIPGQMTSQPRPPSFAPQQGQFIPQSNINIQTNFPPQQNIGRGVQPPQSQPPPK
jgi:small nuclear ribonucleoprotein B and B'